MKIGIQGDHDTLLLRSPAQNIFIERFSHANFRSMNRIKSNLSHQGSGRTRHSLIQKELHLAAANFITLSSRFAAA